MKLYVNVSSASEYEYDYAHPEWAMIEVTPELLSRVKKMADIVKTNALKSASVHGAPSAWDDADEYNIRGDELHVSECAFWYTSYPKHASVNIGTSAVPIEHFEQLLNSTELADGTTVGEYVMHDGDAYTDVYRVIGTE